MDNYIAMLLLVMPGFVARKVYKQTNDIREDLSTFEETMYCLFNSALIILGLLVGLEYMNGTSYIAVRDLFEDISFIIAYGATAFGAAVILGLLTGCFLRFYNGVINLIRRKRHLAAIGISEDVLDAFLTADGMKTKSADGIELDRLIEISKDGETIARGALKMGNMKHREFYLEDCEAELKGSEGKVEMPPITKIYVDGRQGLVIREYDLTGLALAKV